MQGLPEGAVTWAYRILLDREPESDKVIQASQNTLSSLRELRQSIIDSEEYRRKHGEPEPIAQSPFFHYATTFDAIAVMQRHAVQSPERKPGTW